MTHLPKLNREQLQWLNAADSAYAEAFAKRDSSIFAKYGTSEAVRRLTDFYLSKPEVQFGLEKYRIRTWTILEQGDDFLRVERELTHKNVKIHHKTFISLGDDLDEIWTIGVDGKKWIVTRIENRKVGGGYEYCTRLGSFVV